MDGWIFHQVHAYTNEWIKINAPFSRTSNAPYQKRKAPGQEKLSWISSHLHFFLKCRYVLINSVPGPHYFLILSNSTSIPILQREKIFHKHAILPLIIHQDNASHLSSTLWFLAALLSYNQQTPAHINRHHLRGWTYINIITIINMINTDNLSQNFLMSLWGFVWMAVGFTSFLAEG